jgi:transcriptional regulator with XRE-family HTH domain
MVGAHVSRMHQFDGRVTESWAEYIRRISATVGDTNQLDISKRTGLDQTAVSRWMRDKNQPKAEAVITFARAYGRSPIEALIAAGYLVGTDVQGTIELANSISQVPTDDLLAEIRRRLHIGGRPMSITKMPTDELVAEVRSRMDSAEPDREG